jgi:hypothetical protein
MSTQKEIVFNAYPRSIQDLINLYNQDNLNLSPGFQRKSVWNQKDREKLVDSIIRNYPIPAIFLYKRTKDGKTIYDVIDGKQRLESILMFTGTSRGGKFAAKVQLPNTEDVEWVDWKLLQKRHLAHLITDYRISTIEVDGQFNSIIDLFVRINSTGKALTSAEKQHAKYYNSKFLKVASRVAARFEKYFLANRIVGSGQISRMKHVELICELMFSIYQDDVVNKKSALDSLMAKDTLTIKQITGAQKKAIKAINDVKRVFPDLNETRFRQLSDYYVLALLFAKFDAEGLALADKGRNKIAASILQEFSIGVDGVRNKVKKFENLDSNDHMFREYLMTVQQGTDEKSQRLKRLQMLDGLLRTIFIKKDSQRLFSPEQRRLIWNTTSERVCSECGCELTWDTFTLDHIDPHSKGGRSDLNNVALLCRKHNSSKGNRTGKRIRK